MNKPSIYFDQFEFHDCINRIVRDIEDDVDFRHKRYDAIIALGRGGLIPGVVLSHRLGIPMKAINWSKTDQLVNFQLWDEMCGSNRRYLIVDDMVDSGELLQKLFESIDDGTMRVNRFDVAVLINNIDVDKLYENETGIIRAKFWGKSISRRVTPNWIVYWWEKQS